MHVKMDVTMAHAKKPQRLVKMIVLQGQRNALRKQVPTAFVVNSMTMPVVNGHSHPYVERARSAVRGIVSTMATPEKNAPMNAKQMQSFAMAMATNPAASTMRIPASNGLR